MKKIVMTLIILLVSSCSSVSEIKQDYCRDNCSILNGEQQQYCLARCLSNN